MYINDVFIEAANVQIIFNLKCIEISVFYGVNKTKEPAFAGSLIYALTG